MKLLFYLLYEIEAIFLRVKKPNHSIFSCDNIKLQSWLMNARKKKVNRLLLRFKK